MKNGLIMTLALLGTSSAAFGLKCDLNQVLEVQVKNMAYAPQHIEVCAGQTIRWINTETAPRNFHTVTADPAKAKLANSVLLPQGAPVFDSGVIRPGESFEVVLEVVGDYKYFCQPHEQMGHLGSIKVVANEP